MKRPQFPVTMNEERLISCLRSVLTELSMVFTYVSRSWPGISHAYSYTGVSMTFLGSFRLLIRA